jgi:hypothetical protein
MSEGFGPYAGPDYLSRACPGRHMCRSTPHSCGWSYSVLKTGMAGDRHRGFESHTLRLTRPEMGSDLRKRAHAISCSQSGGVRLCPTETRQLRPFVPYTCPRSGKGAGRRRGSKPKDLQTGPRPTLTCKVRG